MVKKNHDRSALALFSGRVSPAGIVFEIGVREASKRKPRATKSGIRFCGFPRDGGGAGTRQNRERGPGLRWERFCAAPVCEQVFAPPPPDRRPRPPRPYVIGNPPVNLKKPKKARPHGPVFSPCPLVPRFSVDVCKEKPGWGPEGRGGPFTWGDFFGRGPWKKTFGGRFLFLIGGGGAPGGTKRLLRKIWEKGPPGNWGRGGDWALRKGEAFGKSALAA